MAAEAVPDCQLRQLRVFPVGPVCDGIRVLLHPVTHPQPGVLARRSRSGNAAHIVGEHRQPLIDGVFGELRVEASRSRRGGMDREESGRGFWRHQHGADDVTVPLGIACRLVPAAGGFAVWAAGDRNAHGTHHCARHEHKANEDPPNYLLFSNSVFRAPCSALGAELSSRQTSDSRQMCGDADVGGGSQRGQQLESRPRAVRVRRRRSADRPDRCVFRE